MQTLNADVSPENILAHDINNQLAILSGAIELVEKLINSNNIDQAKRWLNKAREATRKAASLCAGNLKELKGKITETDVNVYEVLKESKYEGLNIKLMFIAKPIVRMNKSKFLAMIDNIYRNTKQANGENILVELKENNLIFRDDAGGISLAQLIGINCGAAKSSKEGDHYGVGISSIREFCLSNKWSIDFENGQPFFSEKRSTKKGLVIKIGFKGDQL